MSFIGRARESGPVCLTQTLLRAWSTDSCIFHVYYLGLVGGKLGVSCSSGRLVAIYITFGVYLHWVRAPPTRVMVFRKYAQTA